VLVGGAGVCVTARSVGVGSVSRQLTANTRTIMATVATRLRDVISIIRTCVIITRTQQTEHYTGSGRRRFRCALGRNPALRIQVPEKSNDVILNATRRPVAWTGLSTELLCLLDRNKWADRCPKDLSRDRTKRRSPARSDRCAPRWRMRDRCRLDSPPDAVCLAGRR
jgi:hypothetical protein